ncbi:MAG TPA: alanyl-tRNA editing protein [Nitrososphaerales archaeon]|nr:alanyl-tRNA editing protein [Nitrososphaerales archaeon]
MTKRLFWDDMYLREFDAEVSSADGNRLVLDQTAFNPRGGGLVSDTGTLGGPRVSEVVKEGEEIFHVLETPVSLKPGEKVRGVLDWDRRFRIMRMHTSAHILSSVVNGETGALITGNQISPDESRVDFNLDDFDRDKMSYYIGKVNDAVGRELDVKTYFMRREDALAQPGFVKLAGAMPPSVEVLRIVQIGDVDTQADGGVHVRNTREIGKVVGLKTENKGKSNRRLYFTVQ